MKKILTFVLVCLVAVAMCAQENLVVKYKVSSRDTDSGQPRSYDMTLVANPMKSLYYNTMSLYVDSCKSTPEGRATLREIQMKAWRVVQPDGTVTYDGRKLGLAPDKKQFLYVEKDHEKGNICVYDLKSDELYRYTEPFGEMQWEIVGDSTKTKLGYDCILAVADYHGRQWRVWFSTEIPIQDGPWKLRGLPGIILSADGGDGFIIDAVEVGKTSQPVPGMYSTNDYEIGERRKILAGHEHYINNLEGMMVAQGIMMNGDGSPANLPKYDRKRQAWETDY